MPGTDGLIHTSELDHKRVEKVEDVCKEGDILKFKVIELVKRLFERAASF